MNKNIFAHRKPASLYGFLYDVLTTPRPSKKEEKIAGYVVNFAKERGLEYIRDSVNNIIIRKPSSKGYEKAEPVLLTGHMDIVTVKEADSTHDFENDSIELVIDDNWVYANGTTLGADNGCAIAIMLSILDDDSLEHPEIECLFTVQEEIGLCGILAFDMSHIKSRRGIGLDAGSEGVFRKGVSTKYRNEFSLSVNRERVESKYYQLSLHGFMGGHPSVAVPEDRYCAIKACVRILHLLRKHYDLRLLSLEKKVNRGVAEDCIATFALLKGDILDVEQTIQKETKNIRAEYAASEPNIAAELTEVSDRTLLPMDEVSTNSIIDTIYLLPYGSDRRVIERQEELRFFSFIKTVTTYKDKVYIDTIISSDLRLIGVAKQEELCTFLAIQGWIPVSHELSLGWDPEAYSEIRDIMRATYIEEFGTEPIINVSHGSNDCVIIKEKIPDFDVVTTAATYLDYHTTRERLDLDSFEKVHLLVCSTLKKLRS